MQSVRIFLQNGRGACISYSSRMFSSSSRADQKSYKLVVVGGGTGGCSTAARFCHRLGKGKVAVIEPSEKHYYQPLWTLVGGGLKTFEETVRPTSQVLPKDCDWIKAKVVNFDPDNNKVTTSDGQEIKYEFMVVTMGMQLNFNLIPGALEALKNDPQVVSNYAPWTVQKTFKAIKNTKSGNAIFTFPNTPIKCAGAPQKIMYLAEEQFRKNGVRDKVTVLYNTALGVIFGVKKYAASLLKVVEKRNIKVNYRRNLIEVKSDKKEAVFEDLDSGKKETFTYSMLHLTPPMSAPDELRQCKKLVNEAGFLEVNNETLQSTRYPNIFSIGDCNSAPTSKTAAAVASQGGVVFKNLTALMNGRPMQKKYDGYTSCPLITRKGRCILAEFDYNGNPLETFPIDQGKERWTMYHLKADVLPVMYWNGMLPGRWNGPGFYRKALRLGLSDGRTKQA
ncbi:sulfide:quinone oxidoreductase, mitochondrial-like [Saccostrea echinata]|uniref:sulfide:quinone oxidoreductase, mitochondrial-like n=1 Tax=Saccostrea echinata TaxID=191078 RepID=UPI002A81A366|nr:sulfide:quinone oxidoreductase, mitochondrial-like [Saccostrea echinata]